MLRSKTFFAAFGLAALLAVGAFAQEEKPAPAPAPAGPDAKDAQAPTARPAMDLFARRDTNKDGKLTFDELTAEVKKLIAAGDADGDGALTREEFEKGRAKLREQNRPEGAPPRGEGRPAGERPGAEGRPGGRAGWQRPTPEQMFKRMDANGDGNVTLEEYKAAFERMRPRGNRQRPARPGGGDEGGEGEGGGK